MVARTRLRVGVLFTGVLVLLFANLGGSLLWEPDEGRVSLIARGILDATTWRDVLLPHLGSATLETRTAMGLRVADNLEAFFDGKPLRDPV